MIRIENILDVKIDYVFKKLFRKRRNEVCNQRIGRKYIRRINNRNRFRTKSNTRKEYKRRKNRNTRHKSKTKQ